MKWFREGPSPHQTALAMIGAKSGQRVLVVGAGTVAVVKAWHNNFDFGFLVLLTLGFALPGFLFWRRYQRWL